MNNLLSRNPLSNRLAYRLSNRLANALSKRAVFTLKMALALECHLLSFQAVKVSSFAVTRLV